MKDLTVVICSDPVKDKNNKFFNSNKITYIIDEEEQENIAMTYWSVFTSTADNDTMEDLTDGLSQFLTVSLDYCWRKVRNELMIKVDKVKLVFDQIFID